MHLQSRVNICKTKYTIATNAPYTTEYLNVHWPGTPFVHFFYCPIYDFGKVVMSLSHVLICISTISLVSLFSWTHFIKPCAQ